MTEERIMTNDTQAPERHLLKASFEPMQKIIIFFKRLLFSVIFTVGFGTLALLILILASNAHL